MPDLLIKAENVFKTYRLGRVDVPVLRGASIDVNEGEWIAILGASGSGKSTLLHILGDLDSPDRGQGGVSFRNRALALNSQSDRDRYRNRAIGFVFQFYHLLPELNVLENTYFPGIMMHSRLWSPIAFCANALGAIVGMCLGLLISWLVRGQVDWPLSLLGSLVGIVIVLLIWPRVAIRLLPRAGQIRDRASALLTSFGLGHRLKHRPRELSGGERQRVAIARALMNDPEVLLADEPTGNLDEETGREILELIAEQHRKGLTIVMVTHDINVAQRADRIVKLHHGRVET